MRPIRIQVPFVKEAIRRLKAGDELLVSGTIYTARDAAHQRLWHALKEGRRLPIDLAESVIYYAGPTPAPRGFVIGSCGPTTSSRMDAFTPLLIREGLAGMIGKGSRSAEVSSAIRKHGALYCVATGGIGALLALKVRAARVIAYPDLGPEAIHELIVQDFPVTVAIDTKGKSIYAKT